MVHEQPSPSEIDTPPKVQPLPSPGHEVSAQLGLRGLHLASSQRAEYQETRFSGEVIEASHKAGHKTGQLMR